MAAWVGVGGAGAGATGEDEWIQVGLVAYQSGSVRLYYELMRGTKRNYVEVDSDVAAGESHRVTVTEVLGARGWWRATVDGRAVAEPVYLAGSRRGWQPVATAENWRGDCGVNGFRFRFRRVEERESRSWKPLKQPFLLEDKSFQLRRWSRGFDAFGAAQAERPL